MLTKLSMIVGIVVGVIAVGFSVYDHRNLFLSYFEVGEDEDIVSKTTYFDSKSSPRVTLQVENGPAELDLNSNLFDEGASSIHSSKELVKAENSTLDSGDKLDSDNYMELVKNIESMSYSSDRDSAYAKIINRAIEEENYSFAVTLIPKLSYSSTRDWSYIKIAEAAINARDKELAQQVIDKVSYSYLRDDLNKKLINRILSKN